MEINFEVLLKYLAKLSPATVSIAIEDKEPFFVFQRGFYDDDGDVRAFLCIDDIKKILELNSIYVQNDNIVSPKIKEFWEYEVLAKYATQMVYASRGKLLFSEIKNLEKHNTYFPKKS